MNNECGPLFSVVVPVYNAEQYLEQCIESVFQQSYNQWEIILVNDGSKDHSGEICDLYAQKDKRVISIHKENGGPTSARKLGAQTAKGDYVLFVDSDDKLSDGTLMRMHDIISMHSPDAIIMNAIRFCTDKIEYIDTRLPEGAYRNEQMETLRKSLIFNENGELAIQYGIPMKMFRREIYLRYQNAVPEYLYKGEDLAVCAPLLDSCNCVYVSSGRDYLYRDTPGSIMNSFKKNEIDQIMGVASYLEQAMPKCYQSRIDAYVVTHIFDYVDRAMLGLGGLAEYCLFVRQMLSPQLKKRLKRSMCLSRKPNEMLAFYLVKYRLFTALWFIRHIYKRAD